MTSRAIRTITLYPDSVTVEYVEPEKDFAANGLVINHALTIPCTTQWEEGVTSLVKAALELLEDALEDFATSPRLADVALGDDDDEANPYDNPLEREGVQP